jgi:MFS superfamily sulfate permease-like transporter
VVTTVLLFVIGVGVIVLSPVIGGRISAFNYGDNANTRRFTIGVTMLAGVLLIIFGILRLIA